MDHEAMGLDQIVEELNEALQSDVDTIGAYQSAIDSVDELAVKAQLNEFQADHERHITDLRAIVRRCGGRPVSHSDVKGLVQRGMTAMRGLRGTEQTLKAMIANERATTTLYARHCLKPFPPDILDVLRRNYADEQRHLAWIEMCVRNRLWEGVAAHS